MTDFFVSYTAGDAAQAHWVAEWLVEEGYSVRFFPFEEDACADVGAWMTEALDDCDRLIAVASPDYFSSRAAWSRQEREAFAHDDAEQARAGRGVVDADGFQGTIVLVMVRPIETPKKFNRYRRIDLINVDDSSARRRMRAGVKPLSRAESSGIPYPSVSAAATPTPFTAAVSTGADAGTPSFASAVDRSVAPSSSLFGSVLGPAVIGAAFAALWLDLDRRGVPVGAEFLDFAASAPGALAAAGVLFLAFWCVSHGLDRVQSRATLATALWMDRGGDLYRTLLGGVLDRLDRWLSQVELKAGAPPTSATVAWSGALFSSSILAAIVYPASAALLQWTIDGQAMRLGAAQVAVADVATVTRAVIAVSLVGAIVSTIALVQVAGDPLRVRRAAAITGVFTVFVTLMTVLAHARMPIGAVASAALFVAVAYGLLGERASARRSWVWFAAAAVGATVGLALAAGVELAVNGSLGHFTSLPWQAYGLLAVVVSTLALLVPRDGAPTGRVIGTLYVVGGVAVIALAIGTGIAFKRLLALQAGFMVFLFYFPILNAAFDFLSVGATRFLARRGSRQPWGWAMLFAALDLVIALTLIVFLGAAMMVTVHLVRDASGTPIVDLRAVFAGIATEPSAYWWLYLTVFSTLGPTLLHFAIAVFSFLALAPPAAQRLLAWCVENERHDGFAAVGARVALPLLVAIALLAPIMVLTGVVLWFLEAQCGLGWTLFDVALAFAAVLDPSYADGVSGPSTSGC